MSTPVRVRHVMRDVEVRGPVAVLEVADPGQEVVEDG